MTRIHLAQIVKELFRLQTKPFLYCFFCIVSSFIYFCSFTNLLFQERFVFNKFLIIFVIIYTKQPDEFSHH